jgi:prepilin-type N-terminal cleavage/methylation domain-containing protein
MRTAVRAHRWSRAVRHGLTLVELVVVLMVVVLASLVVTPGFIRFHQAWQLQWAARRTLAMAEEARGLAISADRNVTLAYDRSTHVLRLAVLPPEDASEAPEAGAGSIPPPVGELRTSDSRALEYPLDVEVSFEAQEAAAPAELRFYPDGRADAARVRLERPGFPPMLLRMNPRTGRLKREEAPE